MGKASRLKRLKRQNAGKLEKKFADLTTQYFQKEIRNSEIWDQMVEQYGKEQAEKYLKEFKADVFEEDKS